MVTVPFGVGAYKRVYAGEPEVRLENRFLEKNPTNLREHIALLSRAGTDALYGPAGGKIRGNFSKLGLFSSDLFTVSGPNFWRHSADGTSVQITGLINGDGNPTLAWMKGIGYEFLFIADGLLLQYYSGGTQAVGTLTSTGAITNQVIEIGGVYYSWNAAVDTNAPDGTSAHPWLALLGGTVADSLMSMANLLDFNGVRGVDFSTALGGPSTLVSAPTTPLTTTMPVTAFSQFTDGNAITTSVFSGANLAWGGAHLTGGGIHALHGVEMPDGKAAKALAGASGFVLVSVGNSQQFFFILPGEVIIDPLNFAEKESNPDNIVDMLNVGDQVLITGQGSTENWYATGDANVPFAPVEGRVYARGTIDGTSVVVQDSVILVGDDGVVYEVGYSSGGGSAAYGVHRISDHGIEERIRIQLRREQGL